MAEKSKKTGWVIAGIVGLLFIVLLVIIGNVISIGDKIANVHPLLSSLFYLLVAVVMVWLLVIPVARVMLARPMNGFNTQGIANYTPTQLSEYIKELKKSVKLTREENLALMKGNDRKTVVEKIISARLGAMEDVVKKSAVTAFVVTSISQNGGFDFISTVVINFKMINQIVAQLGRRPSYSQLFKLYLSVVSASLVITAVDDIVKQMDFGTILGGIGVAGKALGIVLPSALNGITNAFVTLKVGYATIKYIEMGEQQYDRKMLREYATKSASSNILSVGKDGVIEATKKIGGFIENAVN